MSDDLLSAMRSAYEALNRPSPPFAGLILLSPFHKGFYDVADKWADADRRRYKRELNKFTKKWRKANPPVVGVIDRNLNQLWQSLGVTGIVTTGAIE